VATRPKVVGNETPMPRAQVERLLRAMPPATILVGGQALAFWMARYGLLAVQDEEPAVTRNADLIGALEDARQLARALRGRLVVPHEDARTGIVARIHLPIPGTSKTYNIDVLHMLYAVGGLRKSSEFTRRASARAAVVSIPAVGQIRILHPMDVLASRVNNAAGRLPEKGAHVLTQARWAITAARHALLRIAQQSPNEERPGNLAQEIYRLACSSVGRMLFSEHGIEVADAVPMDELLRLDPAFGAQAEAMRRALAAQRREPGSPSRPPSATASK
jgi:hypothetical protein